MWSATQPHVAALAAVATVGPAVHDRALPPEADRARAAVAATHVELALVDELGHLVHATGGPLRRGPVTPASLCRADTPSCVSDGTIAERAERWASTMAGPRRVRGTRIRLAHADSHARAGDGRDRPGRPGGRAGARAVRRRHPRRGRRPPGPAEEPDEWRTCFERDRDRILHAPAFRRLAGKTQVFIFPADHQRTRLTHALEVAQVATSVARALGLNVALTEAIALGHDCGHGPGGHASEDALSPYVAGGYDHAQWGADVTLAPLNLCAETLDGIRNHSWSRPAPSTPEGEVVSWADRIAYVCHDFEDAVAAGIVSAEMLPGRRRRSVRHRPVPPARHVHPGDGRRRRRDRPHRHGRAGRRRPRRVPPLQLRPRVPASGQPGPGRRR